MASSAFRAVLLALSATRLENRAVGATRDATARPELLRALVLCVGRSARARLPRVLATGFAHDVRIHIRVDPLMTTGTERHWMTHAKSNTKFTSIRRLGPGDELVELTVSVASTCPCQPTSMRARSSTNVRLRPQLLLTSLIDEKKHPADELRGLYHERWRDQDRPERVFSRAVVAHLDVPNAVSSRKRVT
jgi:hypothetical protein